VNPVLARGFFDKECPECRGTGKVTVTCDLCNGTGAISHTLTYQVLDYYEEKINAIVGVYFEIHIRIKNTDNYGGGFSIKETVNIGGHQSFQTQTVYLSSGESREIIFPSTGWYYAGFSTYSHNYMVTPSQVSITCPKCNGIKTITVTCPVCNGSGYVTDPVKLWIVAGFVVVVILMIGACAFALTRRKKSTLEVKT
jgi:RecJ-like exonuclease